MHIFIQIHLKLMGMSFMMAADYRERWHDMTWLVLDL